MNLRRTIARALGLAETAPPQPYPQDSPEWNAVCSVLFDRLGRPPSAALPSPNIRDEVAMLEPDVADLRKWAAELEDRRLAMTYDEWLDYWEQAARQAIKDQAAHVARQVALRSIPKPP